jgi:hypothetical protein
MTNIYQAILEGRRRYEALPAAYLNVEQAIKFTVSEYLWNEAEKCNNSDSKNVLDLLYKITQ